MKCATTSGSKCDAWFGAMITPPVRGMLSIPVQVRLVQTLSTGSTNTTAKRCQNPSPRCATAPPALPTACPHRGPHASPGIMPARGARDQAGVPEPPAGRLDPMYADCTAMISVKRLSAAKSRLRGDVPAARHADLALAMVRDTVTAV